MNIARDWRNWTAKPCPEFLTGEICSTMFGDGSILKVWWENGWRYRVILADGAITNIGATGIRPAVSMREAA